MPELTYQRVFGLETGSISLRGYLRPDRLQCKTRILGATCRDVVLRNGPLCFLFPVQARISTPITKINNAAGDSPTGYGT